MSTVAIPSKIGARSQLQTALLDRPGEVRVGALKRTQPRAPLTRHTTLLAIFVFIRFCIRSAVLTRRNADIRQQCLFLENSQTNF